MKIYICSHDPEAARTYAEGRSATYDWWNHWDSSTDANARIAVAITELSAIRAADEVHVLTVEGLKVPGGMWFETGFAFAIGKRVVLIGPPTNIFAHLLETENTI